MQQTAEKPVTVSVQGAVLDITGKFCIIENTVQTVTDFLYPHRQLCTLFLKYHNLMDCASKDMHLTIKFTNVTLKI